MASNSQSVCLNHPESPAVARCATCSKPVCAQCLVERNGAKYCSVQCADNAEKMLGQANSVIESKKKTDSRSSVRRVIILILLIILAAIGYWYYKNNQETVQRATQKIEQTIKKTEKKAEAKAKETKSEIQNNVPGDSKYKRERENMVK